MKNPQNDTTLLWREGEVPAPAAVLAPRLVMIAGPDLGHRIDLPEALLRIGRESECDVVLPLGGVSREHCSIRREASGVWLRDLGSTNGTRRNGSLIEPHTDVRLSIGDLIAVGGAMFKLLDAGNPEADYHDQVFRTMALDGLTQVRNRRSLEDMLESEISRSRRHRHALSLLLVDIDHFKEVNDQFGHPGGDLVLQRVAAVLARHGRRENCTARYGGDEFVIVLAETNVAGALVFAERVRAAIEHEEIQGMEVTVSIGVAGWSSKMRTPAELIAVADTALYRAKNAGRNRTAS